MPGLPSRIAIVSTYHPYRRIIVSTCDPYRHHFNLRYRQLKPAWPDLLLRWIEATIVGQARRYIRTAFSIFDSGRACDVVWETLEEVFDGKDSILEDSMRSIERRDKAVGHHRETLLNLLADMRNLEAAAQSLDSESALRKPELIEKLYRSLDDKLKGKLEAFLPPDQWSFKTFMQFLSRDIAYINTMHAMKIGMEASPVTKTHSTSQWNPSSRSKPKNNLKLLSVVSLEKIVQNVFIRNSAS